MAFFHLQRYNNFYCCDMELEITSYLSYFPETFLSAIPFSKNYRLYQKMSASDTVLPLI